MPDTPLDIALAYDPAAGRVDVVWAGDDWATDATLRTPLLMSLGTDRRARPEDDLPDDPVATRGAVLRDRRRGWPGDALSASGERAGCRLWTLARSQLPTSVVLRAQSMVREATDWIRATYGADVTIVARAQDRNRLALRVQAGAITVDLTQVAG